MSREQTDTNDSYPDKDIPDGTYEFKVISCQKKFGGKNKDKAFFVWKLQYEDLKGEQVLMPNKMGGLLKVLGCTEDKPGHFDWDTDAVEGKEFKATVSHAPDAKDPTKIRQEMGDFKEATGIPF